MARRVGGLGVGFFGFGFGGGVGGGLLWLKEKVCVCWDRESLFSFWLGVVEWTGKWFVSWTFFLIDLVIPVCKFCFVDLFVSSCFEVVM